MLGCCRCLEHALRCIDGTIGLMRDLIYGILYCIQYPYICLHSWRQDRSHQLKFHHDWYFLLWRCTFPILTLMLVVTVGSLGHLLGVFGYALSAGPMWFYCTFVVIATPFFLVYRYPMFHGNIQSTFWKVLFLCSLFNSAIELFVWTGGKSHHHHNMGQSKLSWLMGNSMFGIVGWIGIPFFFSLQPRVRDDVLDVVEDITILHTLPISPSGHTPAMSPSFDNRSDNVVVGFTTPIGMASKMTFPCALTLFVTLLLTVCAYFPMQTLPPRSNSVDVYWSVTYLLSPILIGWLLYHTREPAQDGDFNLVVIFSTVLTHLPIFLGHLCLTLFSLVEHPTQAVIPKLAISGLFLVVMQGYFYLVTKVIQGFSPPYTHPSLLYGGQLYFYIFWYLLVGSDSPIDALYFAMLAMSNLHVVFANTGIYTDVHSFSLSCCLHPKTQLLSMCVGSSVAVCFRASQIPTHPSLSDEECTDPQWYHDQIQPVKHRRCFSYDPIASSSPSNDKKDDELQQLYFLMKLAEQDHMADTSALILVPSVLTWLTWMESKQTESTLINMWLRCILMFGGRVAGSFLAREIFAYKINKNQGFQGPQGGMSGVDRLRVQRIMLGDFRRQFWYLLAVTTVVAFSCFDKPGWPARYAFYAT